MKRVLLSCFFILLCWEAAVYFHLIDKAFFPNPSAIFLNTIHLSFKDDLLLQLMSSLYRLVIAFVLTFPLALLLALIVAHFKKLDEMINPIVAFTFPLPKVAIYPLLFLIFGIDDWSKIALISIGMFYLMFVNFRIGFNRILSSPYRDILKIFPFRPKHYFCDFLMKGTLQELLTGVKLGLNYGLTLVVVSEITASNNGIGYFIWRSWDQFKLINVWSGVLILSLTGFILYFVFNALIDKSLKKYY